MAWVIVFWTGKDFVQTGEIEEIIGPFLTKDEAQAHAEGCDPCPWSLHEIDTQYGEWKKFKNVAEAKAAYEKDKLFNPGKVKDFGIPPRYTDVEVIEPEDQSQGDIEGDDNERGEP